MAEYFYTVELTPDQGQRLENHAKEGGWDDYEAFAAFLIDQGLAVIEERRLKSATQPKPHYDLDDEIPF